MKKCSVVLEPCTPKLKNCYVSLQQCMKVPRNKEINKDVEDTEIDTITAPSTTEPYTPNTEPALATELRRVISEKNILTTKTKSKFISALSELEKVNSENDRKHRKEKAIAEAINSERAYLKQLEIIITFFKEPLEERYILSADEIDKIFNKVSTLYNVNKELLKLMNEDSINIAQAFKKVAPFFKMYSTYAYEYRMVSNFLQMLEDKNEEFCKFLKCQETRPEVGMKLSSLLITPIQRIPRYCLLLKQILLYTLETESDYQTLKESLQIVEESAKHIDSLVEERENSERLLTIQNSLTNNSPLIIKPGRKLIKEGKVLKMTDTVGNIMYLVVMTDILMFCKIKKENLKSKNALKCSCILPLTKCKFTHNVNLRKIHISCESDEIEIFIETVKEFDQWINVLRESHKNIMNNRYTLRKESSSRRPAHKENLSNYNEVGISPGRPQRKRKIPVTSESLVKPVKEIEENGQRKSSYVFVSKRKCIRDVRPEVGEANINDSLYPLRHHYLPKTYKTHINTENSKLPDSVPERNTDDVFVFGKPDNSNTGFNFKIINFFTYIGHSLQRLFRIK